jgi:hypothetical protein
MKKSFAVIIAMLGISISVQAQIVVKVVPDDSLCILNGYYLEIERQGVKEKIPDYEKALMENKSYAISIDKITEMFVESGVPMSKTASQADILVKFLLNKTRNNGLEWYITSRLQGIDVLTDQIIASASGTNRTLSNNEDLQLEQSIMDIVPEFLPRLYEYYENVMEKGRPVNCTVNMEKNVFEDGFNTKIEEQTLFQIISEWFFENTINSNYSVKTPSDAQILFSQVRIAIFDQKEMPVPPRIWLSGLVKLLETKYKISATIADTDKLEISINKTL